MLQLVHVWFVLWIPEQDTAHQIWPHQRWVKRKDHLPGPAGHALPNAAQDAAGLPGCKYALMTHGHLGVHLDAQVHFCKAVFHLGGPQHILVPGIVPPQAQELALPSIELYEVPACPFLQLVEVLWKAVQRWQLLIPVLYHLQMCWRCTLPHCWVINEDNSYLLFWVLSCQIRTSYTLL